MNREKIEDITAEIISEVIVNTIHYAKDMAKSALTIALGGVAAYFLWNWSLAGVLPALGFLQAMGLALLARILVGPASIVYEPPLDQEERALLIRQHNEEQGGAPLRAVPDDKGE